MVLGNNINISKEEASKIFGFDVEGGDTVNVEISANTIDETNISKKTHTYKIVIKKITSNVEENTKQEDNAEDNAENNEEDETEDADDDSLIDWWNDRLDDATNIIGHLKIICLDLFLMPADALQTAIDSIQTSNYTVNDRLETWDIVMEPDEIKANPYKNKYVEYSTGAENLGKSQQKKYNINAEEEGFKDVTKIPVIPVDLYTIAQGQVEIFDVNFLAGQNNTELHPENSPWRTVRNFITGILHIIIYLASAVLIVSLILHGIAIVKETLTPVQREKHIKGIHQFIISTIMLVSTVVIMALGIFFNDTLIKSVDIYNKEELPVRINYGKGNEDGKDNEYSFSTNILGYLRFMAQINKPKFSDIKALYVLVYGILVLTNLIIVGVMIIRLVIIAFLSIIGPIIALANAFNKESILGLTFQKWIIYYLVVISIQLVLAVICRMLINIGF